MLTCPAAELILLETEEAAPEIWEEIDSRVDEMPLSTGETT